MTGAHKVIEQVGSIQYVVVKSRRIAGRGGSLYLYIFNATRRHQLKGRAVAATVASVELECIEHCITYSKHDLNGKGCVEIHYIRNWLLGSDVHTL